ncbi:hypothetical protein GGF46_001669, partial [Coemansia sp. RSA 552]
MADSVQTAIAAVCQPDARFQAPEQAQEASRLIHQAGACALCVLRFIQIPLGPVYLAESKDILHALGIEDSTGQPCPACLGVLRQEHVSKVVERFRQEGFDSLSVGIGIELPRSVWVRHRAMLVACGLGQTASVVDIKDVFKLHAAQLLGSEYSPTSDTLIEVSFSHPETATEHQFLVRQAEPPRGRFRGKPKGGQFKKDSRAAIVAELASLDDTAFRQQFSCPPPPVTAWAEVDGVGFKRASLFIGGRYLKLERNISQTPFIVEGRRMAEHSVAEIIGEPIQQLARCDSYNLVGSGREDADVRMLGDGRPFYLECINPRTTRIQQADIHQVETRLCESNSPVQVRRLQIIKPEDTAVIKEGEEQKSKHYCALVWIARPLDAGQLEEINRRGQEGFVLQQKTPVRVLHRRAPLTRPKRILGLKIEHIEDSFYRLRMESEAGAYIKEFVHGDLGRTTPSLASMVNATCDILELDDEDMRTAREPEILAAQGWQERLSAKDSGPPSLGVDQHEGSAQ